MSLADRLLGRRLANKEEGEQRIGPLMGVPVLGLDALSSAAYGPETALTVLLPLRALGLNVIEPITALVVAILLIVYLSYRQTIAAYPNGGGSYTVAKENLGERPGLIAAAALVIDYILNVAVGISAGVGALVSAVPALLPGRLVLCLVILVAIALVNLRGVRESGAAFMMPTVLFVGCLFAVLVAAVTGRGVFYYLTIAAVLAVLSLSANTSFADFPRLCRAIALDDYLPHAFSARGRRLVFTAGIVVLSVLAGILLVAFGGVTDRFIPLFAIGAFLAFTMSQAGMVAHWRKIGGRGTRVPMLVNGLGAITTGATLIVLIASKFTEGAWVTVLMIPALLRVFAGAKRHYRSVTRETACTLPLDLTELQAPIVVVPVKGWDTIARKALRFAMKLSPDVKAIHVRSSDLESDLERDWLWLVAAPATSAGRAPPELIAAPSPYRRFFQPFLEGIERLELENPDRQIAVIIPELVEARWYHYLLHNQRATTLKALLLFRGNRRIVVVNVPWYLAN